MRESFLQIEGLDGTVRLLGCDELEACLPIVLAGMPHAILPCQPARPFASVVGYRGRYRLHAPQLGEPTYQDDAINAACDLSGLVARQIVWGRKDRLGLHAAAIAANGALLVLPAERRAGKSLLAIAAAQLGARLFSDDVLPIELLPGRPIMGIAAGISPRLRLPLPTPKPRLAEGVAGVRIAENRQYRYLAIPGLAAAGERLPIGAFVALERRGHGPVIIEPMPGGAMLGSLLAHNFGRGPDAGMLLAGLHALAASVPSFRLVYSDPLEAAIALLSDVAERTVAEAPLAPHLRPSDSLGVDAPRVASVGRSYRRRLDVTVHELDGECYAAASSGNRVLHLNEGMRRIWALLAEPLSPCDASLLLQAVSLAPAAEQVAEDVVAAFNGLAEAGLIVPA